MYQLNTIWFQKPTFYIVIVYNDVFFKLYYVKTFFNLTNQDGDMIQSNRIIPGVFWSSVSWFAIKSIQIWKLTVAKLPSPPPQHRKFWSQDQFRCRNDLNTRWWTVKYVPSHQKQLTKVRRGHLRLTNPHFISTNKIKR